MRFCRKRFPRIDWLIVAALILTRAAIAQAGVQVTGRYPRAMEAYLCCFPINFASLLLTPLYGLWSYGNIRLFESPIAALRMGSRFQLVFEYGKAALAGAFSFTAALNLTALPLVIFQPGLSSSALPFFTLSVLLQFLFFAVCSMIFLAGFLMTGSGILSFLLLCVYGVTDSASVSGGPDKPWLLIGTGRAFLPDLDRYVQSRLPDFSGAVYFLILLAVLTALSIFLCARKDFLPREEGGP